MPKRLSKRSVVHDVFDEAVARGDFLAADKALAKGAFASELRSGSLIHGAALSGDLRLLEYLVRREGQELRGSSREGASGKGEGLRI